MKFITITLALVALTLLLGLSLSACNPTRGTTDGTNDPLPADQGTDFANGYTSSTEQAVSSISLDDVITASSVTGSETNLSLININMPIRIRALPAGCKTIATGSNDDRDEDGIPQEVTYRFNPQFCKLKIPNGERTLAGTLRIGSGRKENNKGGYQERLEVTLIDRIGNLVIIEQRKGTATLIPRSRRGVKQLDKVVRLEVRRQVNGRAEFSFRNNIVYSFVPDAVDGGEVTKALTAGTVSVIGISEWFQGERKTRSFVVNSPTALTYDPACAKQQGQGITGGSETLNQDGKLVRITYGTCGVAPTVQFDPN